MTEEQIKYSREELTTSIEDINLQITLTKKKYLETGNSFWSIQAQKNADRMVYLNKLLADNPGKKEFVL